MWDSEEPQKRFELENLADVVREEHLTNYPSDLMAVPCQSLSCLCCSHSSLDAQNASQLDMGVRRNTTYHKDAKA